MSRRPVSPRFPQEIFDLIIDEAATGYHKDWPAIIPTDNPFFPLYSSDDRRSSPAVLRACALVCWSWYRGATKHLWRMVSLSGSKPHLAAELLSIVNKTPMLAKMIRCVELHASYQPFISDDEVGSNMPEPIIAVICRALPPIASVKVVYDSGYDPEDEEGFELFQGDTWLRKDPVSAMTIISLCRPEHLTTLVFQCSILPTQLLMDLPNLVDLSLRDPTRWKPMYASSPPFGSTVERMPFCLKRARFGISNDVLMPFLSQEPQVFIELEELEIDAARDPHNHETTGALLLWLGGQHLKKLSIKAEELDSCLKNLFFFSLVSARLQHDYIVFPELEHLVIHLTAVEHLAHEWIILRYYLVSPQFACPKLEYLELNILHWSGPVSSSALSDCADIAWEVMHACFGPDRFPLLREFKIRSRCLLERSSLPVDAEDLVKEENRIKNRIVEMERLIASCFPVWEGDRRGLQLCFSCEVCYTEQSEAEKEADDA